MSTINIIDNLERIAEIIDKSKKRLVVNTVFYEKNKNELSDIEHKYHIKIHVNDLVPVDQIFIMASESELEAEFFKMSDPLFCFLNYGL